MELEVRVNEHITDTRTRGTERIGTKQVEVKSRRTGRIHLCENRVLRFKGKPCQANCRVLRRLRLMNSQLRSTLSEA